MIFVWSARVTIPGFREEIFVSPALINSYVEITEGVYEVGMFMVPHRGHALLFLPTMVIKVDDELMKNLEQTSIEDLNTPLNTIEHVFT
jgi:hypothetical protein